MSNLKERERREERIKERNSCLFQSSDSGGFRERRSSPQAVAMATLSLRISIPEKNATKMMQFDPSTSIYDACRIIREKLAEASNMGQRKLLLASEIFNDVLLLTNTRICIFPFPFSFLLPSSPFSRTLIRILNRNVFERDEDK